MNVKKNNNITRSYKNHQKIYIDKLWEKCENIIKV